MLEFRVRAQQSDEQPHSVPVRQTSPGQLWPRAEAITQTRRLGLEIAELAVREPDPYQARQVRQMLVGSLYGLFR